MMFNLEHSKNEHIPIFNSSGIDLYIKREDKIHNYISGNKYRKLKYNIIEAKRQELNTLLTFGGAYSNHIAAVASAGKTLGFKTIGIIRGDELNDKLEENPTLRYAKQCSMTLKFVSRTAYKQKSTDEFSRNLKKEFGTFYIIPEGGTNGLAIKGCQEILTENDTAFDYICCAVGTGGTISGLINSVLPHQKVLGFPALKGDFLQKDISKFVANNNWELITDYHFGGYAKINERLITFINQFKKQYNIPLDPIYTGKMMYGIFDLIKKKGFKKGSKLLAIHTGGLQGINGMNAVLKQKGLPLL